MVLCEKNGCVRQNRLSSGKAVVFGQSGCIRNRVVVIRQSDCDRGKVVVFVQKWL